MVSIPIITIIILFFIYQTKNKNIFGPISLLFLTYIVMLFSGLILELFPFNTFHYPYDFNSMTFLAVCFIVMFSGFMFYRDHKIIAINIENPVLFRMLLIFLIIGGFLSSAFFAPFAYSALLGNINVNRILVASGSRDALNLGRFGLINSFCSLLANLFVLNLVCAFISISKFYSKRSRLIFLLLVSSSLSYVVYILAYVGRDGIVYWLMTYLIIFLLFKRHIPSSDKKFALRIIYISAPILMIPFLAISSSRFSSNERGVAWWLINYLGQQTRNFNDKFLIDAPIQYGRSSFPIITKIIEAMGFHIPFHEKDFIFSYYLYNEIAPWTFSTFIGSFLSDFGKIGTLIILSIMSLSNMLIIKKSTQTKSLKISDLLVFILLLQIAYWGVFYFRQYSANYYILFVLILSLTFKLTARPLSTSKYFFQP